MITITNIGTLELPDGKVDVTDPCYGRDTWCRINDVNVVPGTYDCLSYEYREDDEAADAYPYITQTRIISQTVENIDKNRLEWIPLGNIGVDAGIAGYFPHKPDFTDEQWDEFLDLLQKAEEENEPASINKYGFVSSSGFGDGSYDVDVLIERTADKELDTCDELIDHIKDGSKQAFGIRIIFLDPEEMEDFERI